MEIIVITQTEYLDYEAKTITKLFKEGLKILHLRKPDYSTEQMKKLILEIPEKYRKRIVVHSHHELAIKYNLKGIHLTEAHKKNRLIMKWKLFYYRLRRSDIHVSTTYHDLRALKYSRFKYNYVILSPVFESISKKGHKPKFTLANVRDTLEHTQQRVIAVGGVDEDKLGLVREAGFYGIGLLGAIWHDPRPEEKFHHFLDVCKGIEKQF